MARCRYREVEFLCANIEYPNYRQIQQKQKKLMSRLRGREGILPYRQDFKEYGQVAMAVVVFDQSKMRFVKKEAEKVSLPIDLIKCVSDQRVDDIIIGRLEGLRR